MTRYGGQFGPDLTFLGVDPVDLEDSEALAAADVVVVGAPFDGGTSHRPGTRFGPQAIRQTCYLPHDGSRPHLALRVDALQDIRVVDAGDVEMPPGEIEKSLHALEEAVYAVASQGTIPLVLGGDHSIALPDVTGVARHLGFGKVSMIHFDAHADTGDITFGSLWGHGQPMRRLIESGALRGDRFLQIGLRGYWPEPETLAWMAEQNMRSFEMTEIGSAASPPASTRRSRSPSTSATRSSCPSTSTCATRATRPAPARRSRAACRRASCSTPYAGSAASCRSPASTWSRCRRRTTTRRSPRSWPTGSASRRCPGWRPGRSASPTTPRDRCWRVELE